MSSESGHSQSPESKLHTSAPSSPPDMDYFPVDEKMVQEEEKARKENEIAEAKARKAAQKAKKSKPKTDIENKNESLEELLRKSAAFSEAMKAQTNVLGKVGSGFAGEKLGEHDLKMAAQPKCMTGGKMRDYQLEGLTWMMEIAIQGMSGVLADEMGLGKTIQTIAFIAAMREEGVYGPHMIVAPLSTLSNWMEEFEKWTPTIPVVQYHGTPKDRRTLWTKGIHKHLDGHGKIRKGDAQKFPVIITTPEMVLKDCADLRKPSWEFIIIDEGHKLKNRESKLFGALKEFTSNTRFLVTGTPLQNKLEELWSLLHFLMPSVFVRFESFMEWFDFSDLDHEEKTAEFIEDQEMQNLVKKLHVILQPLLLRRIKADVEHLLPKKREYVLYAPLTKEQAELYRVIDDKKEDTRKYLEDKVFERLSKTNTPAASRKPSPKASTKGKPVKVEDSESEDDVPLAIRQKSQVAEKSKPLNAFQALMAKKPAAKGGSGRPEKSGSSSASSKDRKRKLREDSPPISVKSSKSSRNSTPTSTRSGRKRKSHTYTEVDVSEEELMSDDEVEAKWAAEQAGFDDSAEEVNAADAEEMERAKTLELAKKEISFKKLGNTAMQLRLACNSPHNFYNPWAGADTVDETLISSSGKMLLLDRLLPYLFSRRHKVLIFSQFTGQLNLIEDYARELRHWNVCRIDGSIAQESRRLQIKEFNENPDFQLFLLSTRAGGQGINLASADTVILFDSDWNPQQDLQAQDRVHRIGQTQPVIIYRLATQGTVETELLRKSEAKRRLEKVVIQKGRFKTLDQKMAGEQELSEAAKRDLLARDGVVFDLGVGGGEQILSDADLEILDDRRDEAYVRAARGEGNASGFEVMETKAGGIGLMGR